MPAGGRRVHRKVGRKLCPLSSLGRGNLSRKFTLKTYVGKVKEVGDYNT